MTLNLQHIKLVIRPSIPDEQIRTTYQSVGTLGTGFPEYVMQLLALVQSG